MATSWRLKPNSDQNASMVRNHKVDSMTIVGKGAHGVVHPAYDIKGNKVATKRINETDKQKMS